MTIKKAVSILLTMVLLFTSIPMFTLPTLAEEFSQTGFETTMYVDWNAETRMLQVVQKYSETHDLVSVIKPIAPNNILNFVSPKLIANTKSGISNNIDGAKAWYSMPESDWLGPHHINNDWHGGSHGHGNDNKATGYTDDIVLKVNGKATSGNVSSYAGEVILSYTNYLWNSSTKEVFMHEYYTLTFDGEKWNVDCNIKLLKDAKNWKEYYGMQCTYGAWQESIQYGDDEPISIAKAETPGYTEADSYKCDTMILRGKSGHALEMKMDRTYGLGRGTMMSKTDAGAFTRAYPHPNGKAYFRLVSGGRNPSANAKFMWRGTYRFFNELAPVTVCSHVYDNAEDAICNICGDEREFVPGIFLGNHEAEVGQTITVPIRLEKNPGIVSTTVNVGYDPGALRLINIEEGDFDGVIFDNSTAGTVVVDWMDYTNPNVTESLLATLTFEVLSSACLRTTALTIEIVPENTVNYDLQSVFFVAKNGSVTVMHEYESECDSTCGNCGAVRETTHQYDSTCDTECNMCGETRTVPHAYDDACDADCNLCGAIREAHVYRNACDDDCNICGTIRTVDDHVYSNSADTTCNICGCPHRDGVDQSANGNCRHGDINGDGLINNRDIIYLQRYIDDWEISIDFVSCEINGDGLINNRDCIILQRYVNDWNVSLK